MLLPNTSWRELRGVHHFLSVWFFAKPLLRIIEARTVGPMSQLRTKDSNPFWEEATGAFTGRQETVLVSWA